MAGAHCAAFSVFKSLSNTAPKLLKPLLSSSISYPPRYPKKLTKRKNHLRPKILKILKKPYPIEPVIPILLPPQNDIISEPQLDELVGVVPAVDEVEEVQVTGTESVAGGYSGIFGKLSAMSVLKVGLGLFGVLILQTICSVCFLENSNSDEENKSLDVSDTGINRIRKGNFLMDKNVVYLDETELEYRINEIRAMAREVRKVEDKARGIDNDKDGIPDEFMSFNSRTSIEKEIGTRLSKLEKKLNSRKGKSPGSYMNILNEVNDIEDGKEMDETLMFKKKFKFRNPTSLRSDAKGFSGFGDSSTYKKKKSGIASANRDSGESISGTVKKEKNETEASGRGSKGLQNKAENLEKRQKEMGVGNTDKRFGASLEKSRGRSMVEVMKSRETKDVDVPKLQNFTKGNQEKPMKFDKDSLGGNGSSGDQSDIKSDLWWLKLPYALAILMQRGLDNDGPGGLFTLRISSQGQQQSEISYIIAFEDHVDANNFCCLLESFFEDLGDFSADIVPLSVKELHEEVKSGMKNVIVLKKRQLKLYAGQPFDDVEKALFSLIEEK
ncbi:uncharacterized protein LOC123221321 [Mangifera indica]|uniref:uncharacterized protein LOC123221321 n=1 Tax=Mangifera indica TaxID=29780 RepID=UPI001CFAB43D|nr:uncharacterized protein LOC123221321 [Mangifera indica]